MATIQRGDPERHSDKGFKIRSMDLWCPTGEPAVETWSGKSSKPCFKHVKCEFRFVEDKMLLVLHHEETKTWVYGTDLEDIRNTMIAELAGMDSLNFKKMIRVKLSVSPGSHFTGVVTEDTPPPEMRISFEFHRFQKTLIGKQWYVGSSRGMILQAANPYYGEDCPDTFVVDDTEENFAALVAFRERFLSMSQAILDAFKKDPSATLAKIKSMPMLLPEESKVTS